MLSVDNHNQRVRCHIIIITKVRSDPFLLYLLLLCSTDNLLRACSHHDNVELPLFDMFGFQRLAAPRQRRAGTPRHPIPPNVHHLPKPSPSSPPPPAPPPQPPLPRPHKIRLDTFRHLRVLVLHRPLRLRPHSEPGQHPLPHRLSREGNLHQGSESKNSFIILSPPFFTIR